MFIFWPEVVRSSSSSSSFAWHAYSDRKIGDKDVKMHGQPGSGRSNLFSHIPI
jgi:hypothetical protein